MSFQKMPKLSDRLKYIRQLYNLSQAELAKRAGTTQQAIQQAEKGKARQPRYLHHLANALEVPVEWLVFGDAQEAADKEAVPLKLEGLHDGATDVLDNFYAMPEADQKLMLELMKSRQKK